MSESLTPYQHGAFLTTPQDALAQIQQVQAVFKSVMRNGEHYGVIPGTEKPTLLKPGAELLNNMYGYRLGDIQIVERTEQWDVPVSDNAYPLFRYLIKTTLLNSAGEVIATGVGECNSYESKYRYRKSSRKCPKCGKESIIKGKKEYGGGWVCFEKKGGCKAKFGDNDPLIVNQSDGKVPNENIHDQINTILKMAKKRSYVDATLSATRTSGIFTQDVEDFNSIADIKDAHFEEVKQGLPNAEVENPPVPTTTEEAPAVFTEEQPFDPYTEKFGLGKKYPDSLWIDVPQEALNAAAKHHNNQTVQDKVTATLKAQKERSEKEIGDVFK